MRVCLKISVFLLFFNIWSIIFPAGTSLNSSATATITALVAETPPDIRVTNSQINKIFYYRVAETYDANLNLEVTSYEFSDDGITDLFVRYPVSVPAIHNNGVDSITIILDRIQGAYGHREEGGENIEELRLQGSGITENYNLPYRVNYNGTEPLGVYRCSFRISVAYE